MNLIPFGRYPIWLALTGVIFAFAPPGVRGANPGGLPPANVFDMAEMRDPDTLDIKILTDEIAPVSKNNPEKVRCIHLEFWSHNWGGEDLRHLAKDSSIPKSLRTLRNFLEGLLERTPMRLAKGAS